MAGKSQNNSWQSIQQKRSAIPKSAAQMRDLANSIHKKSKQTLLGLITIVLFGITIYFIENNALPSPLSFLSTTITNIEPHTNGSLCATQILNLAKIPPNSPLLTLHTEQVERRIELLPQVQAVTLERSFPSTLRIYVHEHQPVAKLIAMDNNQKIGLLVDNNGYVFKAYGYKSEELEHIPFLHGFKLQKTDNGQFLPIHNFQYVTQLLSNAKSQAPHLYQLFHTIGIEYLSEDFGTYGSFLNIKTHNNIDIIFSTDNLDTQLSRLNAVLNYASEEKLATIKQIDLSMHNQAAVTLAKNKNVR